MQPERIVTGPMNLITAPRMPRFPFDGGEMGQKVRTFDWSATPLGPIQDWPSVLRVTVEFVLNSKFPKCLVWGSSLTMIYNDAFKPILGNKSEALGRPFSEVWSEAWDAIGPIAERAFSGEATYIEDFPLAINRHGHLEQAFFTFCYSPVRDENGVVVGMMDTVIEMTGKYLAERQLRELANSLEKQVAERTADRNRLWQLSTDIMLVTHFDSVITAANPAWQRMLGWSEQELVGQRALSLIHREDLHRTIRTIRLLSRGTPISGLDNRVRHKDGSYRWISWNAVPGDGLINAVGRDFTAEKEQAEALQQAEENLRHSQKMEAVGQLTGGLAHDFNNLLLSIGGSLELLGERLRQGRTQDLERYIEAAQGATQRAASLTHRLLAFSRRQTLDPRPTRVNHLIADMEELVRHTMGPTIRVDVIRSAESWTALVDRNQLENSLLNLCINARDAMPEGGRLVIETANVELDAKAAGALELAPGEYLSLRVSDTGMGMSAEVAKRACEPFFTTKPTGQGTGLGLSMVYGFAQQSGGQVRIHSETGRGTSVMLYLPRHADEPDAPSETAQPSDMPVTSQGETVLVIDDEATLRMLVTEVLEDLGYATLEAAEGPSGLALLESGRPVDLLITDIGLPGGMNGRQVADAARRVRPGLKVLFITGYAETTVVGNDRLEPDMQILTKPFTLDALANRIKGLLG